MTSAAQFESALREVGTELYRAASVAAPALFNGRGLRGRLLEHALRDDRLQGALFQFIDVLPQLDRGEDVARHFRAYLGNQPLSGLWGRLLRVGNHAMFAWAVKNSVKRVARLFLAPEERSTVHALLRTLGQIPAQATFDAVGEAVLTESEADRYVARYRDVLRWVAEAGVPAPHLSIKLTALTPHFDPLDAAGTRKRALDRLAPLLDDAQRVNAAITIDMEQRELKDLAMELFRALVEAHPDSRWQPGITLQAYLPATEHDMIALARWARERGRRIAVRLVKGAYWDTEVALAAQRRWPVPVFADKGATDASFERLTRLAFEQRDVLYPAIASHNLRSLAHAIALASAHGLSPQDWEIQMLYGMAEPLQRAVVQAGARLRVYVPTGDLVIGIAYLIRRLLENTAGTSVLRQTFAERQNLDQLLAAPSAPVPPALASGLTQAAFENTPLTDFSDAAARTEFARALAKVRASFGVTYPLAIVGATEDPAGVHASINPARPDEVLGRVELATRAHAERAIANAIDAFPAWRDTPARERVALCRAAAELMLERRAELAAWQVFEQGKNWREAQADVAEAIDYLRYYAAQMEKLDGWQATTLFPGETNYTRYEPRGVAVIIAPWNFPLAILTGMTVGALVTGNCAIMKPALPAQIVARKFLEILCAAGFPRDVCQLLPGRGSEIGDFLVSHQQIHVIAFTGSREVGLAILEKAARLAPGQRHVKRVVCEMGARTQSSLTRTPISTRPSPKSFIRHSATKGRNARRARA